MFLPYLFYVAIVKTGAITSLCLSVFILLSKITVFFLWKWWPLCEKNALYFHSFPASSIFCRFLYLSSSPIQVKLWCNKVSTENVLNEIFFLVNAFNWTASCLLGTMRGNLWNMNDLKPFLYDVRNCRFTVVLINC